MPQALLTILVVGATGSVGQHVVAEAPAGRHRVRAVVRDQNRARLPPEVDLVKGDLSNPASLPPAVKGVDAVVFTHGAHGGEAGARTNYYAGVRNVLVALAGRQVRVALMTAIGVTDRGRVHDWKRRPAPGSCEWPALRHCPTRMGSTSTNRTSGTSCCCKATNAGPAPRATAWCPGGRSRRCSSMD